MPKQKPPVSYTNRDFSSIKKDLINYAKVYYPETYKDFNDASFGSLLFDLVAYIGDSMSFYVDYQMNESMMDTVLNPDTAIKVAKRRGYKLSGSPSSTGTAAFYVTVPATTDGTQPETDLIPILKKGTTISSASGASFLLSKDVDFSKSTTLITVAEVASDGSVTSYAMKAYGEILSGELKSESFTVGGYEKFRKLTLGDDNITEILLVTDAEGRQFYEVDYLAQDTVMKPLRNLGTDFEQVPFIIKEMQVPRRYTVDYDLDGVATIQFGHGSEQELIDKTFPDPRDAVLKLHGRDYVSDTSFDPNIISKTEKFGISPADTTILVEYRKNTENDLNVAVGGIDSVSSALVEFRQSATYSKQQALSLISEFEVENEERVVGQVSLPSIDEVRELALAANASQNRAVTKNDYVSILYRMPAKYGNLKRVNVLQDKDSFKRNLNAYVLAQDENGSLVKASTTLKRNLKSWITNYKMMNDTIDILDGNIVNIGINFEVISGIGENKVKVLSDCLQALKVSLGGKLNMGEPLVLGRLYKVLNDVDGVEDTKTVTVVKKTGSSYSSVVYDVNERLKSSGRILTVAENAVLEIKYFDTDVTGVVM